MVTEDDDIPLGHGRTAEPGAAIASMAAEGTAWQGTTDELRATENSGDVGLLAILDTWLRNCDRHSPDISVRRPNYNNVFLGTTGVSEGRFSLTAIDHTHCFSCGRELNEQLQNIDVVKDRKVYGFFPEFRPFFDRLVMQKGLERLGRVKRDEIVTLVETLPDEWLVSRAVQNALTNVIVDRAAFVASNFAAAVAADIPSQGD